MSKKAKTHRDLQVYETAFQSAMTIFQESKQFPKEERYSLTDQIRRSSRSICANLAEAWRRRRYPSAFINKVSEAEAEAAETQVCIEFAVHREYLKRETGRELYRKYDEILGILVGMIIYSDSWTLSPPPKSRKV
jgi:four helix bundle protein